MTEITSSAEVSTGRPGRYAKQLASHMSRRSQTRWDEASGAGEINFPMGGRLTMTAGEDALALVLTCPEDLVDRLEDAVGRHLVRFGARDELEVAWRRSDGRPGSTHRNDGDAEAPGAH